VVSPVQLRLKDLRSFLEEKEGAFNILLRGAALKGSEAGGEGLDAASPSF